MDGCSLEKIRFIYTYYHTYLHKSRFVEMIIILRGKSCKEVFYMNNDLFAELARRELAWRYDSEYLAYA